MDGGVLPTVSCLGAFAHVSVGVAWATGATHAVCRSRNCLAMFDPNCFCVCRLPAVIPALSYPILLIAAGR